MRILQRKQRGEQKDTVAALNNVPFYVQVRTKRRAQVTLESVTLASQLLTFCCRPSLFSRHI